MTVVPDGVFVGRGPELADLAEALRAALRGVPGVALIRGEAGIGKSRVAEELFRDNPDVPVLRGWCQSFVAAELPYSPLIQALRPVCESDVVRNLAPDEIGALAPMLPLSPQATGDHDRWSQTRLFEVVLRLLGRLAESRGLIVLLEDIHWADQATLDLLLFLAANLTRQRVLILTSMRDGPFELTPWRGPALRRLMRQPRCRVVDLGPLDSDAAEHLVARLGGSADASLVASRGAGNPLFLEELARFDGTDVPTRLRDVVRSQLDELSPAAQRLIGLLAVAGTPLPERILARLAADDPEISAAVLREVERAHLTAAVGQGSLALRHVLFVETVYSDLGAVDRISLHSALASAVEESPSAVGGETAAAAVIAHHWLRAGHPERALGPLVKAAGAAEQQSAWADAARLWRRVLRVWDDVAERERRVDVDHAFVLAATARAERWGATPERGIQALREAIRICAHDRARSALLEEQLARQYADLGRVEEAMRGIARATDLAGEADPSVRARVQSTHAVMLMTQGQYERSRRECERVLALEAPGLGWEKAQALSVLGVDLVTTGQIDEGIAAGGEALALAGELGDVEAVVRSRLHYTYVLETAGRWEDALESSAVGMALVSRSGLSSVAGSALLNSRASCLIAKGSWPEARSTLEEALLLPGSHASHRYAALLLAEVEIAMGSHEAALGRLEAVAAHIDSSDAIRNGQLQLVWSQLHLSRGDAETALSHVFLGLRDEPDAVNPGLGLRTAWTGLRAAATLAARERVRGGDHVVARRQARDLLEVAERLYARAPVPPYADEVALCRLEYERCRLEHERCADRRSGSAWERLAAQLEAHGRAYLAAYALYREAEQRLATGGRSACAVPLRAALRLLRPLRAAPLIAQVEALAASCQVRTLEPSPAAVPGPARPGDALGLTRREWQVLGLVAEGDSNRQIARALGMSEKTASVHVSNILGKLNVSNRAEATALTHRLGLLKEGA